MLANYIDLRKAFDSVNHLTLWEMRLCGIPARITRLLSGLYSGTVCLFPVDMGVGQVCMHVMGIIVFTMDEEHLGAGNIQLATLPQHTVCLSYVSFFVSLLLKSNY